MAKRGNGEGSIRRRKDGRYEGRYTDEAGRQRSVYGKTHKDAVARLVAAMDGERQPRERANAIVREYFAGYDDVARDTMRRRGYETYHSIARLHILPETGDTPLSDLTRQDVQSVVRAETGRRTLCGSREADTRSAVGGYDNGCRMALHRS